MGFGFVLIDAIFPVLFILVFVLVFGVIAVSLVRGAKTWNRNNHSTRLTVEATVVAKRMNVSHHHASADTSMHHSSTSTFYYVTFQVPSGDRMELGMSGQEYGMLVEGDHGRLSFQGTRYLGFERS